MRRKKRWHGWWWTSFVADCKALECVIPAKTYWKKKKNHACHLRRLRLMFRFYEWVRLPGTLACVGHRHSKKAFSLCLTRVSDCQTWVCPRWCGACTVTRVGIQSFFFSFFFTNRTEQKSSFSFPHILMKIFNSHVFKQRQVRLAQRKKKKLISNKRAMEEGMVTSPWSCSDLQQARCPKVTPKRRVHILGKPRLDGWQSSWR